MVLNMKKIVIIFLLIMSIGLLYCEEESDNYELSYYCLIDNIFFFEIFSYYSKPLYILDFSNINNIIIKSVSSAVDLICDESLELNWLYQSPIIDNTNQIFRIYYINKEGSYNCSSLADTCVHYYLGIYDFNEDYNNAQCLFSESSLTKISYETEGEFITDLEGEGDFFNEKFLVVSLNIACTLNQTDPYIDPFMVIFDLENPNKNYSIPITEDTAIFGYPIIYNDYLIVFIDNGSYQIYDLSNLEDIPLLYTNNDFSFLGQVLNSSIVLDNILIIETDDIFFLDLSDIYDIKVIKELEDRYTPILNDSNQLLYSGIYNSIENNYTIEIYDPGTPTIDLIYEYTLNHRNNGIWMQNNLLIIFDDYKDIIYFYDISIPSALSLVRKINLNNYF